VGWGAWTACTGLVQGGLKGGVIGGVTSMGEEETFLPGMVSIGGGSGGLFSASAGEVSFWYIGSFFSSCIVSAMYCQPLADLGSGANPRT